VECSLLAITITDELFNAPSKYAKISRRAQLSSKKLRVVRLDDWAAHGDAILVAMMEQGKCIYPAEEQEALLGFLDPVYPRIKAFTEVCGFYRGQGNDADFFLPYIPGEAAENQGGVEKSSQFYENVTRHSCGRDAARMKCLLETRQPKKNKEDENSNDDEASGEDDGWGSKDAWLFGNRVKIEYRESSKFELEKWELYTQELLLPLLKDKQACSPLQILS
jgi:hypothetical protein